MAYLGTKPANAVLTSEQIGDGVITTADLADGSITQTKLATSVAGTGPAFSAYASATTSIPNITITKVLFQTEEFDTNNNFASSRFTPTVAGYYQINACLYIGANSGFGSTSIFKNGVEIKSGNFTPMILGVGSVSTASSLIYLNGSSDFVEIYGYQNSGATASATALQAYTWFNGSLVRAA
jgi:hypothetical protein